MFSGPIKPNRAGTVMLGTDPAGKGGVSSVVGVLMREGFFEQHGVRFLTTHVGGSKLEKLWAMLQGFGRMWLVCLFRRPLIVHAHSASRASFVRKSLLLAMARGFGCKTIFHLHGGEFKQFSRDESGSAMRWWIRHTLEKSARVIALSQSWADYLRQYAPAARVEVVPNPVTIEALPACPAEDPNRILFLGRTERAKGIHDLLAAVALARATHPAIRLAIGGDGDLVALGREIERLGIERNVEILGWIDPVRKRREFARAAIFVLPSHNEGLPMSMLEAMAAGKAVVMTPVGGIPEAITHEVNGLLVPVGDAPAIAEALTRLLADRQLRRRLGKAGLNTIRERFSTDRVLGQLSALYREMGGG